MGACSLWRTNCFPPASLARTQADGRLCYLDFGLVVRVTPEHRQAMMVRLPPACLPRLCTAPPVPSRAPWLSGRRRVAGSRPALAVQPRMNKHVPWHRSAWLAVLPPGPSAPGSLSLAGRALPERHSLPTPRRLPRPTAIQSALVHLGLGEWERLVGDMEALDLLRPGTDK